MTREMPMSSCIIFIKSWDATNYQWLVLWIWVTCPEGSIYLESLRYPPCCCNEQKWMLPPSASPDSRGTGISIDPARTNCAAHTGCTRYTVHLCTTLCIFKNGSVQSKTWLVLLKPVESSCNICLFYLLFEATNLVKSHRSTIVVLW